MAGSADDLRAPESWELADLDESMNRLNLTPSSNNHHSKPPREPVDDDAPPPPPLKASDDVIGQVDQFLREAIQNPRERVSVLRMEQDVESFMRDPNQQQLEFRQLPTSYLRLAAHRVALHYSLQSMVLMDNSLPDGSGSRIIVRKTSESKPPLIRLVDIPVKLSIEDNAVTKVAIKQRPQKQSHVSNLNSDSTKNGNSKSVEERKEEYNRARARIFSSSNNGSIVVEKPEYESQKQDSALLGSLGVSRVEVKPASVPDVSSGRGLVESSANNSRPSSRIRTEKEPVGRYRQSNRVAVFRDREVDRKDPDYDRSYDRYMQRFDPGFGFNGGSYNMQPMYTPVVNYNTEFPHLGPPHGPQLSSEHHQQPLMQHIPGLWAPPSTPPGMGYGHPDTILSPFNPSHAGGHFSPTLCFHSSQYSCQRPMPFIHHEPVYQPFAQPYQLPPDASFGMARPR